MPWRDDAALQTRRSPLLRGPTSAQLRRRGAEEVDLQPLSSPRGSTGREGWRLEKRGRKSDWPREGNEKLLTGESSAAELEGGALLFSFLAWNKCIKSGIGTLLASGGEVKAPRAARGRRKSEMEKHFARFWGGRRWLFLIRGGGGGYKSYCPRNVPGQNGRIFRGNLSHEEIGIKYRDLFFFNNTFAVVHIHNTLFPAGSKIRKTFRLPTHLKSDSARVCVRTGRYLKKLRGPSRASRFRFRQEQRWLHCRWWVDAAGHPGKSASWAGWSGSRAESLQRRLRNPVWVSEQSRTPAPKAGWRGRFPSGELRKKRNGGRSTSAVVWCMRNVLGFVVCSVSFRSAAGL